MRLRVHEALECVPSINADGVFVRSLAKVCASILEMLSTRA